LLGGSVIGRTLADKISARNSKDISETASKYVPKTGRSGISEKWQLKIRNTVLYSWSVRHVLVKLEKIAVKPSDFE